MGVCRGGYLPRGRGVCLGEVSTKGGGLCKEFLTHACENITYCYQGSHFFYSVKFPDFSLTFP